MNNIDSIVEKFKNGSFRALGKAITIVENNFSESKILLDKLHTLTGKAQVLGFTGSPGAGKSSLIDSFVTYLRTNGLKVGVVAVDPSSPFTGGAILGDRIRMIKHSTDKGVFIRSMANRGQVGGLGTATKDTVKLLDAFGFDIIIVETVGTGQTEIDIVKTADTIVLVLNPETGDDIQAIKAGIMEIADIFVINKADLPGAGKARLEIETSVREANNGSEWNVPVILTSSYKEKGIDELFEKVKDHWKFLNETDELNKRRLKQLKEEIMTRLFSKISKYVDSKLKEDEFNNIINSANNKEITASFAVDEIFKRL